MRKDYAGVDPSAAQKAEEQFVEDYWSQIWNGMALDEGRIRSVWRSEQYLAMRDYLRRLPAGARVLDGGCGMGEWTLVFRRLGFDAYGVDLSKVTCERLLRAYPGTHFQVGDIRELEFPDGFFDLYFSWGTFEHFEEGLEPCFREARRVLHSGGLLCVTVPFYNGRLLAMDAAGRNVRGGEARDGTRRFYQWRLTRDELRDQFTSAGFEVLSVLPVSKRHGVVRYLHHRFGWEEESLAQRMSAWAFSPWLSRDYVCHMLMGIGVVPERR